MILSKEQITKAPISLRRYAGWSAPLLFANPRRQVLSLRGQYKFNINFDFVNLNIKKVKVAVRKKNSSQVHNHAQMPCINLDRFGNQNMAMLYPNPCYNEICYKRTELYMRLDL